ncbi:MAG: hypothetical protein HND42_01955 [Armatimonadetes bacterium]|nr:hypothetical protein [Armatimonadota bacterium]NOG91995.1 hypothetical protein [Armatimonadota bacterium]
MAAKSIERKISARIQALREKPTGRSRLLQDRKIYLASLEYRLEEVDFIYRAYLSVAPAGATTDPLGDYLLQTSAYADAFWALSYSIYDIFAHVLNSTFQMVKEEKDVSFLGACDSYKRVKKSNRVPTSSLPKGIADSLEKITKKHHFKRLANYRHLCLHRRDVKIEASAREIRRSAEGTQGETIYEDIVVCDNPSSIRPTFKRQRLLREEMASIWDKTKSDILILLKSIEECYDDDD